MGATTFETTSLVLPFSVALEVREAAGHTMLTNADLAEIYEVDEVVIRHFLRGTPVAVNLFWAPRYVAGREEEVGTIFVTTPKGEEKLGDYQTWGDFWAAAGAYGWLYREDFRRLNSPNLPDLGWGKRNIYGPVF